MGKHCEMGKTFMTVGWGYSYVSRISRVDVPAFWNNLNLSAAATTNHNHNSIETVSIAVYKMDDCLQCLLSLCSCTKWPHKHKIQS